MKKIWLIIFIFLSTYCISFSNEKYLESLKEKLKSSDFSVKNILANKEFLEIHKKVFDSRLANQLRMKQYKTKKKIPEKEMREIVFVGLLKNYNILKFRETIEKAYALMLFEFDKLEQEQAFIFYITIAGKCSDYMSKEFNRIINDKRLNFNYLRMIINLRNNIIFKYDLKDKESLIEYIINVELKPGKWDVSALFYLLKDCKASDQKILDYIKKIRIKNNSKENTIPFNGVTDELDKCVLAFKDNTKILNELLKIYLEILYMKKVEYEYKKLVAWSVVNLYVQYLSGKDIGEYQNQCLSLLEKEKDVYLRSLLIFMLCKIKDKKVLDMVLKEYLATEVKSKAWSKLIDFFDHNNYHQLIPIMVSQVSKLDCSKKALCKELGISINEYDSNFKKTKAYALLAKIIIFHSKINKDSKNIRSELRNGDLEAYKKKVLDHISKAPK